MCDGLRSTWKLPLGIWVSIIVHSDIDWVPARQSMEQKEGLSKMHGEYKTQERTPREISGKTMEIRLYDFMPHAAENTGML